MKSFEFRKFRDEIATDGLKVTPIIDKPKPTKPIGKGRACKGRVSYLCGKKQHHRCVSLTCGCECHKSV